MQNARALLERELATIADGWLPRRWSRSLPRFAAEHALPLWNLLVRLEREHGDIDALRSVERRRADIYLPLEPLALRVALDRYASLGLFACNAGELAAASASVEPPQPSALLSDLRVLRHKETPADTARIAREVWRPRRAVAAVS